jgi:hypothetical protein
MTPTNDVSLEIQRRKQTANKCFFGLRKYLRSSHHKTLIGPVLLYGSETWVLTKTEENQFLVFKKIVLRTICGPKIEMVCTGGGTTMNLIKSLSAQMPYMSRRQDLPQKALFRAKPNGRRNQGRLKSRWADGVNSNSLALGVRNWTYCAQDRQTWRDLLQQALTRYWLLCHRRRWTSRSENTYLTRLEYYTFGRCQEGETKEKQRFSILFFSSKYIISLQVNIFC